MPGGCEAGALPAAHCPAFAGVNVESFLIQILCVNPTRASRAPEIAQLEHSEAKQGEKNKVFLPPAPLFQPERGGSGQAVEANQWRSSRVVCCRAEQRALCRAPSAVRSQLVSLLTIPDRTKRPPRALNCPSALRALLQEGFGVPAGHWQTLPLALEGALCLCGTPSSAPSLLPCKCAPLPSGGGGFPGTQ